MEYQIKAQLVFSFFFSIGIFLFSIVRFLEKNYIVATTQFIFSIILIYGFFRLRKDKAFYKIYNIIFFITFLLYVFIIFFHVPQNSLNILWVIFTPVLIFFFLNRQAGIIVFLFIFSFICYLILSGYHYNIAEFITLISSFLVTSFMMYMYENMKESETKRLREYTRTLQKEVEYRTKEISLLNTQLKQRVQEEIQKQQSQEQMLLCQNRRANMGLMIDSIAHQWRQPLMHINTILMNISRVTETNPHNVEYIDNKIDDIFVVTEQMSQTINDFRNLFNPDKEKVTFLIENLIDSVLTLLMNRLKEIDVEVKILNSLKINTYQNELSQAIIIILHNAIEALNINQVSNKKITLTLLKDHDKLNIIICDNAGGIPIQNLSSIFQPYFSTKKELSGSGLGLYIAKIIVERSIQGSIQVKNIQHGAQFTLCIPL